VDAAGVPADLATSAWDVLAERLDALADAWQSGEPPSLVAFLPPQPSSLRRHVLIELVKLDLEYRWHNAQPKQLEQYVEELPELSATGVPCDLIYEEFHVRAQSGDTPRVEEYFERFPDRADELRRLFDVSGTTRTTSLYAVQPVRQLEVGDRLDDFELLRRLGKGAFATVFLARQHSMQRLVALKVSADRGREPQTLAQLDHPHIVRVFDQRRLPDDGLRLLYMQYLRGGTLEVVIERMRRVAPAERSGHILVEAIRAATEEHDTQSAVAQTDQSQMAEKHGASSDPSDDHSERLAQLTAMSWPRVVCWLGERLAAALDYAHGRGVLHRDVKPANILLGGDGRPLLADFNISFNAKADGIGAAAYFGGSLAYMSPEQLEACNPAHPRTPDELDGRSDVFSLGVVLWQLLTGERPWRDERPADGQCGVLSVMANDRRAGVPAAARAALPADLPPSLVPVLHKCLAPDPADRFTSADELARELAMCCRPRVQKLLYGPPDALTRTMRRFPLTVLAIAVLLPNLVLSGLNIPYNWNESIRPDSQSLFTTLVFVINVVAYGAGLTLAGFWAWPIVRAMRWAHRGPPREATSIPSPSLLHPANAARSASLVRPALLLGERIGWLVAAMWTACGVAFAVTMSMMAVQLPQGAAFHFVLSQIGCGLMAGTMSFFLLTFLAVRGAVPLVVDLRRSDPALARHMTKLSARVWIYLAVYVAVPFLSVILLALVQSDLREAFLALGILGVLGVGLALPLALAIRGDLAALGEVVDRRSAMHADT